MNNLPVFSRMVKAIGDHVKPEETAFRYDIITFLPNGTFVRQHAVDIKDLLLRAKEDKMYEIGSGSERQLVSADEWKPIKAAWDVYRAALGYFMVDEFGNAIG